ncbi:MAG TPA: DNA-directed RNA polymerase subunit alpha C-terminal domain-containing protein, partial [Planctomycetota bacterium]|nr:DNA-directed RNA polymerase subunit alpha C-terminal domain-containing protein [Planctomycetota bacterium]
MADTDIGALLNTEELKAEQVFQLRKMCYQSREHKKTTQDFLNGKSAKAERRGMIAWACWKMDVALEELEHARTQAGKLIRGCLLLDLERPAEAVEALKGHDPVDGIHPAIELAEAYIQLSETEKAQKEIHKLAEGHANSAVVHYLKGRLSEMAGESREAAAHYERAVELDPNHSASHFRLATIMDLYGDDEAAEKHYRAVSGGGMMYSNAQVNLGLLKEDQEDFDHAAASYRAALAVKIADPRTALYLKNAEASHSMYFDENERKEAERLENVLRTPITDFELSVRSRNCLAKMGIRTLGDIVTKTESELLNYKNFGETSLSEIKAILTNKNLRLGMTLDRGKLAHRDRLRGADASNSVLNRPVTDIEFSVRARRCMQRLNIETIGDLVQKTEQELT